MSNFKQHLIEKLKNWELICNFFSDCGIKVLYKNWQACFVCLHCNNVSLVHVECSRCLQFEWATKVMHKQVVSSKLFKPMIFQLPSKNKRKNNMQRFWLFCFKCIINSLSQTCFFNVCTCIYYLAISQALETTEFMNLIGWNRYWLWYIDQLHFGGKKFGSFKFSSSLLTSKMLTSANKLH